MAPCPAWHRDVIRNCFDPVFVVLGLHVVLVFGADGDSPQTRGLGVEAEEKSTKEIVLCIRGVAMYLAACSSSERFSKFWGDWRKRRSAKECEKSRLCSLFSKTNRGEGENRGGRGDFFSKTNRVDRPIMAR